MTSSAEAWHDVGLVLAAGAGRRFGQPKAPFLFQGERLVDRAVRVLHWGGCEEVWVVLGAWVGAVHGATVTWNPQWQQGLGNSLCWGLAQLEQQVGPHPAAPRRAVISLVDLPGLTTAAVRRIREEPAALVAASYGGVQGHPVLIAEHHWPALRKVVRGDRGAKQFLQQHRARLVALDSLADGNDLDRRPLL